MELDSDQFKMMCRQLSKRGGYYEYTTTPEGVGDD
jgi:hypothetical protein